MYSYVVNNLYPTNIDWVKRDYTIEINKKKHLTEVSFHVKSHTQKLKHFRLFTYLVHKVYIL